MADFTWIDALKFGSASGVIAGLSNQGFGFLRDLMGYKNTEKSQAEERAHQAALRAEAAHGDARSTYLPLAQEVREWIDYSWGHDFGLEVDYHGSYAMNPAIGPAEAIARLGEVATGHPSAVVRRMAGALKDSIDGVVNMIDGNEAQRPGVEDYSDWLKASDEVVEAIHLPSIS
jgi:hypothetical protein